MRKWEKRDIGSCRNEFAVWMTVCRHFFPDLPMWLNDMNDPRNASYITYKQSVLIMLCIMKNVGGIETMREMNDTFNTAEAISNLAELAEENGLDEMPDWQTVNNYLESLSPKELHHIRKKMIRRLLRSKQFDRYKLLGNWVIVIDGTGIAYFKERHCEHDLVQMIIDPETGEKTTRYYHKVLEAKLILAPSVVVSIDTEFIENEKEDVAKQDCELKAAERLLCRIKKDYPKLPLCVLGDGLYATMPFMGLCNKNHWHYVLNLKEGRQGALCGDFNGLVRAGKGIIQSRDPFKEGGTATYVNRLDLSSGKPQICNVFEYCHPVEEKGVIKEVRFVWVTDIRITQKNLKDMIRAGRARWKIENEGFNNQKNGIYKIEHLCSKNQNAMKCHYLITQISDIIEQLFLSYNKEVWIIYRAIKSIAEQVRVYFTRYYLDDVDLEMISKKTALRLQPG